MNNLQWLYQTNETFREAVQRSAADWLGSTSANFADAWLRETHRSDYEDLTGQHVDADVDSREKLEADVRKYEWANQALMLESFDFSSLVIGWLDRQAAITEHEVLSHPDERDEQIAELNAFAKRLEEAAKNGDDVTLFGVDYATVENAEYLKGWDSASVADLLRQYENGKLMRECDMETHVLIETEEMRKALNEAVGKWAKADARNRELSKMLMLDDGTVEDYTERLDLQKALDYQKQLADEYHEDWRDIRAYCDGLESQLETLRETAEKYRADAIAAQKERDAYRELCGRMRKMANDMLCMEVD